jgi:hypothetical protein
VRVGYSRLVKETEWCNVSQANSWAPNALIGSEEALAHVGDIGSLILVQCALVGRWQSGGC